MEPLCGDCPAPKEESEAPLDCVESDGRLGKPMRCCCRARAFCMMSIGSALALGGGLRALLRAPVTLEVEDRRLLFWGSDMVRS
jgi:hypothetical protein